MVPETWTQKATSQLGELLQRSSSARMASIKLANMEYASELSAQLLEHAQQLEKLYQDLSKAITDNADDKSLRKLVSKSLKLEEFGIKAQVRIAHQKNGLVLYIILYVTKKSLRNMPHDMSQVFLLPDGILKQEFMSPFQNRGTLQPFRQPLMLS